MLDLPLDAAKLLPHIQRLGCIVMHPFLNLVHSACRHQPRMSWTLGKALGPFPVKELERSMPAALQPHGVRAYSAESVVQMPQGIGLHPVRAYHAGCKIQLQQLLRAFPAAAEQGRHHVILQLDHLPVSKAFTDMVELRKAAQASTAAPQFSADTSNAEALQFAVDSSTHGTRQGAGHQPCMPPPRLALAFTFGSVVFFPSHPAHDDMVLKNVIQPFILDPEPKVHDEDTLVEVRPDLDKWVERGRDKIIVRTLDLDNLSLIACALGQSAALDNYTEQTNAALEEYHAFKLGRPSSRPKMRKGAVGHEDLLQMVARNRQLRVEVIGLLGILDKSEAAWRSDKYFLTWQTLSNEFELPTRLDVLLDKLSYLEDEVKYELDTRHDRNLEMLVNIVIVLLLLSVMVTVYHLCKRWALMQKHDQEPGSTTLAQTDDHAYGCAIKVA